MPQFTFYDIAGVPDRKALGCETFSPEECQLYERALSVEVAQGNHLVVRKIKNKRGRFELIIGETKIGEPLVLVGEEQADARANPAPAVQRALDIPDNVTKATDGDLEIIAARAGITVDEKWKRRNRALRNADVARRMVERKAQAATA